MNEQYFIHTSKEKKGPFTLEELKQQKIDNNTHIWAEGFDNWKKVSEVEAVYKFIRSNEPPPFVEKATKNSKIFRFLGVGVIILMVTLLVTNIIKYISNSKQQPTVSNVTNTIPVENVQPNYSVPVQTYEEKKISIEDDELQNPSRFIQVTTSFKKTLFGGNIRLSGDLKSNASIATYKDIILEIQYLTQTDTYISSEQFTIYEYLKPNQSISFREKFDPPSKTSRILVSVITATASNK